MRPLLGTVVAVACFAIVVFVFELRLTNEATINLMGAALGAAIAVYGAVWATRSRERRRAHGLFNAMRSISHASHEATYRLHACISAMHYSDAYDENLLIRIHEAADRNRKVFDHLELFTPVFVEIGAEALASQRMMLDLLGKKQAAFRRLDSTVNELATFLGTSGVGQQESIQQFAKQSMESVVDLGNSLVEDEAAIRGLVKDLRILY